MAEIIDLVSAEEGMQEEVDVVRSPSAIGGGRHTLNWRLSMPRLAIFDSSV